MKKLLITIFALVTSISAFSSECASNTTELKRLFGNSDFPMEWFEDGKNPLALKIQDSSEGLLLKLSSKNEPWATVVAEICPKGNNYVGKVRRLAWGSAAPGIAKKAKFKELSLKLPYQSRMKVSIFLFSFDFDAVN